MTLGATSDIHGNLEGLDFTGCDIAVFAGDVTKTYGFNHFDVMKQARWMENEFSEFASRFPSTHFVVIPGNHDLFADPRKSGMVGNGGVPKLKLPDNVHFLVNSRETVLGVVFQGISWVPHINGMWAYEDSSSGRNLQAFCESIVEPFDVLVTHSPPRIPGEESNIDVSLQVHPAYQEHFGSTAVYDMITRMVPRYVFCGHIHSGDHKPFKFVKIEKGLTSGVSTIVNVSRVDESYTNAYDVLRIPDVSFRD